MNGAGPGMNTGGAPHAYGHYPYPSYYNPYGYMQPGYGRYPGPPPHP